MRELYAAPSAKMRLGPWTDGGYVICRTILDNATALLSGGYGGNDGFERDWLTQTGRPVTLYDGSCPPSPLVHEYPSLMTYHHHHLTEAPVRDGALLKLDIEGAEYHVLQGDLSQLLGLVVEWHTLSQRWDAFTRIHAGPLAGFVPYHAHGNNYTGSFIYEGRRIPETLEMSYIHRRAVPVLTRDTGPYPTPLDAPNCATAPECDMQWVGQ